MTKGDNNEINDIPLYPQGRSSVYREEVIGVVRGYVPYVGRITLMMKENPKLLSIVCTALVVVGIFG